MPNSVKGGCRDLGWKEQAVIPGGAWRVPIAVTMVAPVAKQPNAGRNSPG